mmetsp:Transcript_95728/g.212933  ORF Transcript_95728/g.212933 Transcript_95728/m.212933 type:complete len:153 (+) Transcript_95728:1113-1571(+)
MCACDTYWAYYLGCFCIRIQGECFFVEDEGSQAEAQDMVRGQSEDDEREKPTLLGTCFRSKMGTDEDGLSKEAEAGAAEPEGAKPSNVLKNTRKCFASRAYHSARSQALKEGHSPNTAKTQARSAHRKANQEWDDLERSPARTELDSGSDLD